MPYRPQQTSRKRAILEMRITEIVEASGDHANVSPGVTSWEAQENVQHELCGAGFRLDRELEMIQKRKLGIHN